MRAPLPLACLAALALCTAAVTAAAQTSLRTPEWRRTLIAPFGQHRLLLEAPSGMCFLDETDYLERQALNEVRALAGTHGNHRLIAAFADCLQISALGTAAEPSQTVDAGFIFWRTAETGGETRQPLDAYLDARAATLPADARKALAGYTRVQMDDRARRTADGATVGYTARTSVMGMNRHIQGVTGATLIGRLPVDIVILHRSGTPVLEKKSLYTLMDGFITQQRALNARK